MAVKLTEKSKKTSCWRFFKYHKTGKVHNNLIAVKKRAQSLPLPLCGLVDNYLSQLQKTNL
jgi:hypothetical protein